MSFKSKKRNKKEEFLEIEHIFVAFTTAAAAVLGNQENKVETSTKFITGNMNIDPNGIGFIVEYDRSMIQCTRNASYLCLLRMRHSIGICGDAYVQWCLIDTYSAATDFFTPAATDDVIICQAKLLLMSFLVMQAPLMVSYTPARAVEVL